MEPKQHRLNILHLRDSPWVDGPGRTILETATNIDKQKYNYIIGSFFQDERKMNPLINAARERNLNVFPIHEAKSFDHLVFQQILDYIDMNNVHIIHCHEVRSDIIGLFCAKRKKIPLVTTLHGWIGNSMKAKLLIALDKFSLHFFDRVVVVSKKMKEQLSYWRISEKKIRVIQNAIIIGNYSPNHQSVKLREELKVDNETFLIAKIGRLSPEKGFDLFLRAIAQAKAYKKKIKALIIGIGPLQKELEQLTVQLGLQDHVIFLGFRAEMQEIYNALNLVVQCSHTEGMPNVILESLLMEVPVIATDVGGTSEIVSNDKTGILVPPGDDAIIAQKICEVISRPDHYLNLAKNGRNHVIAKFSFYDRTEKLVRVYEEIANEQCRNNFS